MNTPTENADFLVADNNNNVVSGLGGDDFISGLGGNDTLNGDAGNDLLIGGRGNDILNGGAGFDTANYNDNEAAVFASLFTGQAVRTINGIAETDTLISIEGLTGGAGGDQLIGNDIANTLQGLGGFDVLRGLGGDDKIFGGDGNDTLTGGQGADILDGGAGFDYASYEGSTAGVKVNLATGTATGGDAQGDVLTSIECLYGSDHNDTLTGDGSGNYLTGGLGADTLNGGGGDDVLTGGAGADHLNGGIGTDVVEYSASLAGVHIDLLNNTASGGDATGDVITGIEDLALTDFADTALGNDAANRFFGGGGDDTLSGRGGTDTLYGEAGNDTLNGGGGTDYLIGGAGRDVMTGGSGKDIFYFPTITDTGTTALTRDLIKDFTSGSDSLSMNLIDANSLLAGDQAFKFIGTQGFTGAAGDLHAITSGANTILEGDVNGDKIADFQIEFTGHLTFALGDIVL